MSTSARTTTRRVVRGQVARDVALASLIVLGAAGYHIALTHYLAGLDRPLILEIGFLSSLFVAWLYEFKAGVPSRYALVGCLAQAAAFVAGTLLAEALRLEYIQFISAIRDDAGFSELVGHDIHAALSARVVGFGGCFAVGLVGARLTVGGKLARRFLQHCFILPAAVVAACPCCGQPVAGAARTESA